MQYRNTLKSVAIVEMILKGGIVKTTIATNLEAIRIITSSNLFVIGYAKSI